MNPLSARARLQLDRYRAAESMPTLQRERLLGSILDASARGVAPKFDAPRLLPVAPKPSVAERVWATPGVKPVVAVLLLSLPALALLNALPSEHPEAAISGPAVPLVPLSVPETVAEPRAHEAPAVAKPILAPVDSSKPSPKSGIAKRATLAEPTIDGEMRILNQAEAANRAGDSRHALALLDEYTLRFPAGRLADVRAVARLVALCQLGEATVARREALAFQLRYPTSPFNDRVKGICAPKVLP